MGFRVRFRVAIRVTRRVVSGLGSRFLGSMMRETP